MSAERTVPSRIGVGTFCSKVTVKRSGPRTCRSNHCATVRTPSAYETSRRDRRERDVRLAAVKRDLIVEVDRPARVVGDDGHDLADLGLPIAARDIEVAVFLREATQDSFRILDDETIGPVVEPQWNVRRQRL